MGAVEAGAHAIETDIHLSKDGVVVLSHVCLRNDGEESNAENLLPGCDIETMFWK